MYTDAVFLWVPPGQKKELHANCLKLQNPFMPLSFSAFRKKKQHLTFKCLNITLSLYHTLFVFCRNSISNLPTEDFVLIRSAGYYYIYKKIMESNAQKMAKRHRWWTKHQIIMLRGKQQGEDRWCWEG